jgi:hypothetical protein
MTRVEYWLRLRRLSFFDKARFFGAFVGVLDGGGVRWVGCLFATGSPHEEKPGAVMAPGGGGDVVA